MGTWATQKQQKISRETPYLVHPVWAGVETATTSTDATSFLFLTQKVSSREGLLQEVALSERRRTNILTAAKPQLLFRQVPFVLVAVVKKAAMAI